MRKFLCLLAALALLVCAMPALAEGEVAAIGGVAFVTDDRVYYAGSVDGKEVGVFRMGLDGSNPTRVYEGDAVLLACYGGKLLIEDWESSQLVLLSEEGEVLFTADGDYYSGAASEEGFCAGNLFIAPDGSASKTLFEVGAEGAGLYAAAAVTGGYYYYYDASEYYATALSEGEISVSSLKRVPLSGGETATISGAGTRLIGIEGDCVVYERSNFSVSEGEDYKEIDVQPGLYKNALDGSQETALAATGAATENSYVRFDYLQGGVVYGQKIVYDDEGNYNATLQRVNADGQSMNELSMPDGTICFGLDGTLYLTVYGSVDGDENTEWYQADSIVTMNLESGAVAAITKEGAPLCLYYSEGNPQLAARDGYVYMLNYDYERYAVELDRMPIGGGEIQKLALGFEWQDEG